MAKRKETAHQKELRLARQRIKRMESKGTSFPQEFLERLPRMRTTSLHELRGSMLSYQTVVWLKKQELKKAQKKEERFAHNFLRDIERRDRLERERIRKDVEYASYLFEGEIVYAEIMNLIANVGRDHMQAANDLFETLQSEIDTYGRNAVMRDIGQNAGAIKEAAEMAVAYNPNKDGSSHERAIQTIKEIITGRMITDEEKRELDELAGENYYDPYE